jgi:hypothetical protein
MAFIFIVHGYLMKVYSRIQHSECSEYVADADLGGSLHIALKAVGDISHYVHPPPFTIL